MLNPSLIPRLIKPKTLIELVFTYTGFVLFVGCTKQVGMTTV